MKKILITGGCGYIGSRLVPFLLARGYDIRVIDSLIYKNNLKNFNFELVGGDIRDSKLLKKAVKGIDAIIHLAAISNDPTAELNPQITKEVNYDAVCNLLKFAKEEGVKRVILASSSTVYGFKGYDFVAKEDDELNPLTIYGKYKAESEKMAFSMADENFIVTAARPATVGGFSLRQRFDLVMNIFVNHAYNNKKIIIMGGKQNRPVISMYDMCRAYYCLLTAPASKVNKEAFNIRAENMSVEQIGKTVAENIPGTKIEYVGKSEDKRSYLTSNEKIKKVLGFETKCSIKDAINELVVKFDEGYFKDPLNNSMYFNIKRLKELS